LRALDINANDTAALDGLLRAAISLNKVIEVERLLTRLAASPANTAPKLALSRWLASQGNMEAATRIPLELLKANPGDVPALEQLASILSDLGDAARLEPVVQRLVEEAPKNTWSHYYASSLFFQQGRLDMALQAARNAVSIDPANAKAHNLIGASLASMGNTDAARTAFAASLKADPRDPGTYSNLATLELQAGNREQARKYFTEALTIDPSSQAARDGLNSIP
jgi:Flp pilus assembly protein TadD